MSDYQQELKGVEQQTVSHIRSLFRVGQLRAAFSSARHLVKSYPLCAEHWLVLSEVLSHPKVSGNALVASKRAVTIAPDSCRCIAQMAICLVAVGDFSKAQSAAESAFSKMLSSTLELNAAELDAMTFDKLGLAFNHCGEFNKAYLCFQHAVTAMPKEPHYLFNLATMQRAMGELDAAEESFTQVIAIQPDNSSAYLARSSLRKVTPDNHFVAELEKKLDQPSIKTQAEINLSYAVAKELEDLAQYPRSFQYLKRGSDCRRRRMKYDVSQDIDAMDKIKDIFTHDSYQTLKPGHNSHEPIFILGLPRTGTTLVERILSSHEQVYAAGELQNFSIEMVKLAQDTLADKSLSRTALIEGVTQLDYQLLGSHYIESTRPRTGHTPHFIDKLPLNFLYLGLIHKALPNAKIIHLTRSPMDTCYAIYKTLFEQAYPFSYDLMDLAKYYVAYRGLMAHWQSLLGDSLIHISYEELVADQEKVSRSLLQSCGLQWQDNCLHFQKNQSPTATASSSQVRQGIYNSSIERWQSYSDELQPLQQFLEAANINPLSW